MVVSSAYLDWIWGSFQEEIPALLSKYGQNQQLGKSKVQGQKLWLFFFIKKKRQTSNASAHADDLPLWPEPITANLSR